MASGFVAIVLASTLIATVAAHRADTALTLSAGQMGTGLVPADGAVQLNSNSDVPLKADGTQIVRAAVTGVVDNIDPQAQSASMHVLIQLPDQIAQIVSGGDPMCAAGGGGRGEFRVLIETPLSTLGSETETLFDHVVTAGDLANAAAENVSPVLSINVGGVPLTAADPGDYPFDTYRLLLFVRLELMSGQLVSVGGSCVNDLPIRPYAQIGGRLDDLATTLVRDSMPFSRQWTVNTRTRIKAGVIQMRFERPGQQRSLTLIAAAIPLLLAFLFGIAMFAPRRKDSPGLGPFDFLVGIAASLLAILPLRATLLPSAIQSRTLTTLDLILALEVALLVYVAAVHPFITFLRSDSGE
jgi:hypothetical protein